jgi:glycosyltransferase involved in cell wall biosynthesis
MLVSVVIPTYNPGPDLDAGIASLLAQTLPADQFEIVIVDDGSTDDTPAHLDELASRHENIVVVHSENSGWAGRPRNIGIRHAGGEYVQFMDQDDQMSPDALRRLVEIARRNHSDVVLGKVVSDFRGVALGLYRENRDVCTIHDAPIIDSLTPHKMFRRAFLLEHRIEFPEGRRRLEDQLFVVKAYFAARVISILADEPCYFYLRRTDRGNAGATPLDPDGYYANLREVLDVVIANTEPGEERARLVRRFARNELLGRMSRESFLSWDPAFRARMFANVRSVLLDYVDDRVVAGLDAVARVRAGLIRDDRPDALLELGRRTVALRAPSSVEWARWEAGRLKIGFVVEIEDGAGAPLVFDRRGKRFRLGSAFMRDIVTDPIDVTDELKRIRVGALVRERETSVEWRVSTRLTIVPTDVAPDVDAAVDAGAVRLPLHVVATLDPGLVAGDRPLPPGDWVLRTRLTGLGLDIPALLGGATTDDAVAARLRPLFGRPDRLVTLRLAPGEGLSLEVARVDGPPAGRSVYRPPSGPVWRATGALGQAARGVHRRLPTSVQDRSAAAYRAMRTRIRPKR